MGLLNQYLTKSCHINAVLILQTCITFCSNSIRFNTKKPRKQKIEFFVTVGISQLANSKSSDPKGADQRAIKFRHKFAYST